MDHVPAIVTKLAAEKNGRPISWRIHEDGSVTVVMEDGRKLHFEKETGGKQTPAVSPAPAAEKQPQPAPKAVKPKRRK